MKKYMTVRKQWKVSQDKANNSLNLEGDEKLGSTEEQLG
jgi:hypothetical protein